VNFYRPLLENCALLLLVGHARHKVALELCFLAGEQNLPSNFDVFTLIGGACALRELKYVFSTAYVTFIRAFYFLFGPQYTALKIQNWFLKVCYEELAYFQQLCQLKLIVTSYVLKAYYNYAK